MFGCHPKCKPIVSSSPLVWVPYYYIFSFSYSSSNCYTLISGIFSTESKPSCNLSFFPGVFSIYSQRCYSFLLYTLTALLLHCTLHSCKTLHDVNTESLKEIKIILNPQPGDKHDCIIYFWLCSAACEICNAGIRSTGIKPVLPAGEAWILTTGPPGKCHGCIFEHILQNMSNDYIMCIFPYVTIYCKLLLKILLWIISNIYRKNIRNSCVSSCLFYGL